MSAFVLLQERGSDMYSIYIVYIIYSIVYILYYTYYIYYICLQERGSDIYSKYIVYTVYILYILYYTYYIYYTYYTIHTTYLSCCRNVVLTFVVLQERRFAGWTSTISCVSARPANAPKSALFSAYA